MNLLLIAVLAVLIIKIRSGYKRGMVKEVIMLLSLIVLCITVALITNAMKSYQQGQIFNTILMVLMLTILGVVQFVLKPVFFSAKLVVKLPIVSWADKMLGILVGILETVLLLWTLDFFVMIMDMGGISEQILEWTRSNLVLKWFFENNYLAFFLQTISQKVSFLPHLL
ncbi:MAG: CvpA family protein [Lachnospiraceae bacterium]|nr:CvpA family protein [Lachnospiraceae bacterium]MBR6150536.1 CvpA family protein [Lachnospiraceae bacterium]